MEGKKLVALSFCAFTVPAVLILPSAGWLWAGLATLISGVLLWGLLWLRRGSLTEETSKKPLGKALLLALFLWNLIALGMAARQLCESFPTAQDSPLVGLLLLLLAAYCGKKRSLPVGAVCFFLLLGLYGLFFAFALPDLNGEYLRPQGAPPLRTLTAALLPLNAVWLCKDKKKFSVFWIIGGVAFAVAASVVTAGILSAPVAAQMKFPFYEAAKSITLLGSIQRLEPLVSAGLCLGGFCLLSLLCAVNEELVSALAPQRKKLSSLTNFLAGGAVCLASQHFSSNFIALGTTIFWGILPFFLLLVVNQKNIKKI